jgi:hypothetical protein
MQGRRAATDWIHLTYHENEIVDTCTDDNYPPVCIQECLSNSQFLINDSQIYFDLIRCQIIHLSAEIYFRRK